MRYVAAIAAAISSLAIASGVGDVQTASSSTSTTSSSSTTSTTLVDSYQGEGGPEPIPTTSSSSTSTTTTLPIDPEWQCAEWLPTAVAAGWPADPEVLRKLGQVIWAETRCQATADNGGDVGLVQLHWRVHTSWLAAELGVTERSQLLDPMTNLAAGWWLYNYAAVHYGCPWQPWYSSGSWCP